MAEKTAVPKKDGKCDDGYTPVWIWCFKQTVLNKLSEPLQNISVPQFTDVGCEAAISALKTINKSVESALEAPRRYMQMMQQLVDYPFDVAQNMVNTALSTIDKVDQAIDELLGGAAGAIDALKSAVSHILDCPFLVDTPVGKLAAEILDAINEGAPYDEMLRQLKNELGSTAREALDNARETPTESINNLRDAYDSALKRSGIDELVDNMKKLEQCVEQLCAAYKDVAGFVDRLPKSADSVLESAGAMWDSATGSVKQIAVSTTTDLQKQALKVADDVKSLGYLRW